MVFFGVNLNRVFIFWLEEGKGNMSGNLFKIFLKENGEELVVLR